MYPVRSDIILPESHKIVSTNLYDHIKNNYGIDLNYNRLMWGCVSPDFLPQYKIKRHYYEESIDFLILKISKLIFLNRFLDFKKGDYAALKLFSTDIGVISHYLTDYNCIAHAENWVMPKNLIKHLNYEKDLNDYAKTHKFDRKIYLSSPQNINASNELTIMAGLKDFISENLSTYLEEQSKDFNMGTDLDYALAMNIAIFDFVLETILSTSKRLDLAY